MPYSEDNIYNKGAFIFFILSVFFYEALFSSIVDWYKDLPMLTKECVGSRWYDLEVYSLAKVLELPGRLVLPLLFLCICYPMANMSLAPPAILGVLAITVLTIFAGDSVGVLIASVMSSLDAAIAVGTVVAIGMLIVGGFYIHPLPVFMQWTIYLSVFNYAYNAGILCEFRDGVPCDDGRYFMQCYYDPEGVVSSAEVIRFLRVQGSFAFNVAMLLAIFVSFRTAAYLSLKFIIDRRSSGRMT